MPREALNGWRVATIFGIPIEIAPSWLLIFLLIFWSLGGAVFPAMARFAPLPTWGMSAVATLLFFASLLGHELCHSLVSRRYGLQVRRIVLFLFGGVSESHEEMPSARAEFWIAIAGPASSLAMGAIFWGIGIATRDWLPVTIVARWLALINVALAIFNLLPGFPLDGGRVFRAVLWGWRKNYIEATRWASWGGEAIAVLLGVWGVASALLYGDWLSLVWLGLLAFLLYGAAEASYRQAFVLTALRKVSVADLMRRDLHPVHDDQTLPEAVSEVLALYPEPAVPVTTHDDALVGILTAASLEEVPRQLWPRLRVTELMKPLTEDEVVHPDTPAIDALKRMQSSGVDPLPVVEDHHLVGVVGEGDLQRYIRWHPAVRAHHEKV